MRVTAQNSAEQRRLDILQWKALYNKSSGKAMDKQVGKCSKKPELWLASAMRAWKKELAEGEEEELAQFQHSINA
eukprot:1137937-Pelagomonas_calceolata.AAC.2